MHAWPPQVIGYLAGGDVRSAEQCSAASAVDQAPVDDEADLVGAAGVEVVSRMTCSKNTRPVQHLGQGELGLQDRQLVAVPRITVW